MTGSRSPDHGTDYPQVDGRSFLGRVGSARLEPVPLAGVDASRRLDGAAVEAAGKAWVGRYVSSFADPKDVSRAEIDDLNGHGVAVLVVLEDGTYSLTPAQAMTGVDRLDTLGAPKGTGLVLADDNNQPPAQSVSDMTRSGVIIRDAGYLAGFYGAKGIARQLQGAGAIDIAWVVDTWGWDTTTDRWNFRQLPNASQAPIGGVACDADDAPYPVGLWLPPSPAPQPPPTGTPVTLPTGEPGMKYSLRVPIGPTGVGHAPLPGVPVDKVVCTRFNGAVDSHGTPLERAAPTCDYDDVGGAAQVNVYGSVAVGGLEDCTVYTEA